MHKFTFDMVPQSCSMYKFHNGLSVLNMLVDALHVRSQFPKKRFRYNDMLIKVEMSSLKLFEDIQDHWKILFHNDTWQIP